MRTLMLLILLAFSVSVSAGSADISRGQSKAAMCTACHGANGISVLPDYPNLAGQNKEYLQYALKAYRDGKRKGGFAFIMQANASALSDQDIEALAVFFSSQNGKQHQTC